MVFTNNFNNEILRCHSNIIVPFIRYDKPLMIAKNTTSTNIYNPIIGSNIGIPLNCLQYLFTTTYYNHNIVTPELFLLQIAIGIFTYGSDRLFDSLDYKEIKGSDNVNEKYTITKINYYEHLLKNFEVNAFVILCSYIYISNILLSQEETYPLFLLFTSTIFYKNFKQNFGLLKSTYIGFFWMIGCIILPCVLHDNNYEILNHPTIYFPGFLTMFSSSNLIDIQDIDEDKEEGIDTLAVLLGEKNTILASNLCIFLGLLLYLENDTVKNYLFDFFV